MKTEDKALAILKYIAENSHEKIRFSEDMGGNSMTLHIGFHHTHIGYLGATLEELVNNLYSVLIEKYGLSWSDAD